MISADGLEIVIPWQRMNSALHYFEALRSINVGLLLVTSLSAIPAVI